MTLPFGKLHTNGIFEVNDTAIISDMHYGNSCSNSCTKEVLETVSTDVTKLILNGDILHSFPPSEAFSDAIAQFTSHFDSVIYIEGNHERMVGGIEEQLPTEVEYTTHTKVTVGSDTVCVTHGDFITTDMDFSDCEYIVIGHLHPVTDLGEKCVLQTPFPFNTPKVTWVLLFPAFGPTGGNNTVNRDSSDFVGRDEEVEQIHSF